MPQSLSDLSIVFAGTPDFSARHLEALLNADLNVKAVYCQPDRPKGRGKKLIAPPTKQLAEAQGISVYQPLNFKAQETVDELAALKPDIMIVVAYGLILPKTVLDIPRLGCINVHASLLPKWRGAAPIERAIEAGDTESGVTTMQMDIGMDTGDMLKVGTLPITPTTTGDSLREAMAKQGCDLLLETLEALVSGKAKPVKQDDTQATYAPKLQKAEGLLDWQLTATSLQQRIQAFNSANACFFELGDKRIKVYEAQVISNDTHAELPGEILSIDKSGLIVACLEGQLKLEKIQLPGGKPLTIQQFLNGNKHLLTKGAQLG